LILLLRLYFTYQSLKVGQSRR